MYLLLKKNKFLFIPYLTFLVAGLIAVLLYSKSEMHLYINRLHNPFLDVFFRYSTWLGSGYAAIILVILFLFIKIRYALVIFCSYAASGILVQLLKHIIFYDYARPAAFFKGIHELYLIPGIEMLTRFSFPSGHAATALALAGVLALVSGKNLTKLVILLSGLLIAYSRVYLSQHFIGDILTGSFIGILAAFIFYWYFQGLKPEWLNQSLMASLHAKNKRSPEETIHP